MNSKASDAYKQLLKLVNERQFQPLDPTAQKVVYSGWNVKAGKHNGQLADEYCKKHNAVKIDDTPDWKLLKEEIKNAKDLSIFEEKLLEKAASKRFVSTAQGSMQAFTEGYTKESVWNSVERRFTSKNQGVHSINEKPKEQYIAEDLARGPSPSSRQLNTARGKNVPIPQSLAVTSRPTFSKAQNAALASSVPQPGSAKIATASTSVKQSATKQTSTKLASQHTTSSNKSVPSKAKTTKPAKRNLGPPTGHPNRPTFTQQVRKQQAKKAAAQVTPASKRLGKPVTKGAAKKASVKARATSPVKGKSPVNSKADPSVKTQGNTFSKKANAVKQSTPAQTNSPVVKKQNGSRQAVQAAKTTATGNKFSKSAKANQNQATAVKPPQSAVKPVQAGPKQTAKTTPSQPKPQTNPKITSPQSAKSNQTAPKAPNKALGPPPKPVGAPAKPPGPPKAPVGAPKKSAPSPVKPVGSPTKQVTPAAAKPPVGVPTKPVGTPPKPTGPPKAPVGSPAKPVGGPAKAPPSSSSKTAVGSPAKPTVGQTKPNAPTPGKAVSKPTPGPTSKPARPASPPARVSAASRPSPPVSRPAPPPPPRPAPPPPKPPPPPPPPVRRR